MHIVLFILYSYLITAGISILILPIRVYNINKIKGKRKAIIEFFYLAGLCLIPYIPFFAMIFVIYEEVKEKIEKWVRNDPTAPRNKNNPNFISPPPKKKKFKCIKNRFEILDL